MPNFFEEVHQLPGKSKLNIYALLIAKLSHYDAGNEPDSLFTRAVITDIKILFNNHEQKLRALAFILKSHLKANTGLSEDLYIFIQHVIETLEDMHFQKDYSISKVSHDDAECRFGRLFESHIAIKILEKPGPAIWKTVSKVSSNIIEFIETNRKTPLYKTFLANLGPDPEECDAPNLALAFARFAKTPNLKDIIITLKQQNDLARTMLIHFMFMRDVYPCCETDWDMQMLIKKAGYGGTFGKYISVKKDQDFSPFFFNYTADPLYADRGRGRFDFLLSKHLGICTNPEDRTEFPTFDTAWYPDSICQAPDLHSPYTQSLIQHDIPYVAGPSGMTSLLCASMLFMGRFENMREKHQYILAIMAFITGGGLHSIHEVLTVPNVRFGLLEFYKPFGPGAGNYDEFFNLFQQDKVVTDNIDAAWDATIDFVCRKYPQLIPIHADSIPDSSPISCCFM